MIKVLKRFSKKVAFVQTFLILTIVYILVAPIFALLARIFKKKTQDKSWSSWKQNADTMHDVERQF